jgi:hypothetical protein
MGVLSAIHVKLIRMKSSEAEDDLVIDNELRAKHKLLVDGMMRALEQEEPSAQKDTAPDCARE